MRVVQQMMLFGQVKAILRLPKRISNAGLIAFLAPGDKFFCEMILNLQKGEGLQIVQDG